MQVVELERAAEAATEWLRDVASLAGQPVSAAPPVRWDLHGWCMGGLTVLVVCFCAWQANTCHSWDCLLWVIVAAWALAAAVLSTIGVAAFRPRRVGPYIGVLMAAVAVPFLTALAFATCR